MNEHAHAAIRQEFENIYRFECFDKDGNLKWVEEIENLVVNAGLDDVLDKYFKGSGYTAAHFVGLTADDPVFDAADVMNSHSGWTEVTAYGESNRPTLQMGSVSGQSINNSGNKVVFTINGTTTVGGAFVTTNNTKGGTTGTLYGGGVFSQNRDLVNTDVLNVTVTATAAAA